MSGVRLLPFILIHSTTNLSIMIKLNFLDVSHSDQVVTVGTHDIEELCDILSRWLRNHYWVIRICPNKMMISTKKLENCILYCVIAFAQKDFSHKSDRGHFRRILTAPLSRITDTTFMSMFAFYQIEYVM